MQSWLVDFSGETKVRTRLVANSSNMPKFAANIGTGFMFNEHDFLERFAAAKSAGFEAIECAWDQYGHDSAAIKEICDREGLKYVLLNTHWDCQKGEAGFLGYGIHPGMEAQFDAQLEKALNYADAVGCPTVHIMSGIAPDSLDDQTAKNTLVANLKRALKNGTESHPHIKLVIEPINTRSVPGYWLGSEKRGLEVLSLVNDEVDEKSDDPRIWLQLDLFHAQIADGDVSNLIKENIDKVAHMQMASIPNRNEPCYGELNYDHVFKLIDEVGYKGWIGGEYKPKTSTLEGLKKWFSSKL